MKCWSGTLSDLVDLDPTTPKRKPLSIFRSLKPTAVPVAAVGGVAGSSSAKIVHA